MKRSVSLLICLTILLPLSGIALLAADERVENLESIIIESFDDPDSQQWYVRGSKFVAEDMPVIVYADAWPEALFGRNREERDLKVLGVNAAFDRKGYNFLEFIPVKENSEGDLEPDPINLPGRVQQFDVWVWGSNYNYYLEVHVRDFTGRVHVLKLGDLNFVGWHDLRIFLPSYIPQAGGHITSGGFIKTLDLVKLVLWTKPGESVSGFNIYLDQIKILTDTFVTRFDGDDLADPIRVGEIWDN